MSTIAKWTRKGISGAVIFGLLASSAVVPLPIADMTAEARAKKDKPPKPPKPPKFEDNCEPLRQPFTRIKNYQTGQILKGAALGAAAGVLIGVIEAAGQKDEYLRDRQGRIIVDAQGRPIKKKKDNNVLEYGVAGAVAGGLIGYLTSIEQNRRNQAELQAALGKFDEERAQYSQLPQALAELGNCRNLQVFTVQQQFEAGILTAEQAGKRLDKVDAWVAEDDEIIAKASKSENESIRTYAQANAVAEGMSAEVAKEQGDAVIARYEAGADRLAGTVELEEDATAAASVRSAIAASAGARTAEAPATRAPGAAQRNLYVSAERGANVRAQPSATATVLGTAPFGASLPYTDSGVAGWAGVTFEGKPGFVSRSLLSETEPSRPATAPRTARRAPRPEVAPIRISYQPVVPRNQPSKVTRSIGDGRAIKAVNAQRQLSFQQASSTARSRLAASVGSAQT